MHRSSAFTGKDKDSTKPVAIQNTFETLSESMKGSEWHAGTKYAFAAVEIQGRDVNKPTENFTAPHIGSVEEMCSLPKVSCGQRFEGREILSSSHHPCQIRDSYFQLIMTCIGSIEEMHSLERASFCHEFEWERNTIIIAVAPINS